MISCYGLSDICIVVADGSAGLGLLIQMIMVPLALLFLGIFTAGLIIAIIYQSIDSLKERLNYK